MRETELACRAQGLRRVDRLYGFETLIDRRSPDSEARVIDLPDTAAVPVVRTDFSNDSVWDQIKTDLLAPAYDGSGYGAALDFVERRDLSGMSAAALENEIPRPYPSACHYPFMIVVDTVAMKSPEHPVLLLDLSERDTSASFRALPREVAAIEANLSIANMDFPEFAVCAGGDGIFRGFD
jgi:hypothetical protein